MIRAALYARFSSDNQREESITAQFRDGEEYCRKHGYVIVARYADEAKSGTTTAGRDEYKRMLADAKAGKFDIAIFHKIDRNARNQLDYYMTKKWFEDAGVKYAYSKQEMDLSTPEGGLMEGLLQSFATYYSQNLAMEVRKGLRENVYAGKTIGGRPPFGFMVSADKKLLINEEEAPTVRRMYEWYAAGISYGDILRRLYEGGRLNRSGRQFSPESLYDILRNPRYKGTMTLNKTFRVNGKRNNHRVNPDAQYFEHVIPAVVSDELWADVQKRLDANKRRSGAWSAKHVYALSGKIYCGLCGRAMVGQMSRNRDGTAFYYYRCPNTRLPGEQHCHAVMVRQDGLEEAILDKIKSIFLSPHALERIKELVREGTEAKEGTNWQAEAERLRKLKKAAETQYERVLDIYADGHMDKFAAEKKLETIKKEMDNLQERIEDAENHDKNGPLTDEKVERTMHLLRNSLTKKTES